jgi:hypothetical protein
MGCSNILDVQGLVMIPKVEKGVRIDFRKSRALLNRVPRDGACRTISCPSAEKSVDAGLADSTLIESSIRDLVALDGMFLGRLRPDLSPAEAEFDSAQNIYT